MQISVDQLRKMVFEAVRARLSEQTLQEGPKEIQIRSVMLDMKEPIVGSITEDIHRETGIEELQVEAVVSKAYDKMIQEIVMALDIPMALTGPRRRVVGGM